MKRAIILALGLVAYAASAFAATQFQPGTPYETTALTGYQTTGSMMTGMTVKATFADGSVSTAFWATTGPGAGAASGTGWGLSEAGDTFENNWLLSSSVGITKLFIDAGTGDTVFDTIAIGDVEGTPGSARGMNISDIFNTAIYKDSVALTGHPPVGDLFRTLEIDFTQPVSTYTFNTDTDNLKIAGDITPTNPVPEPSTIILVGAGLVGLGMLRRRAKK